MIKTKERGALDFVFARREVKYRVPADIYPELRQKLKKIMKEDLYPRSCILSIYYDTENNELISRSLAGGSYKEKLRLRSYGIPGEDTMVFPELKKKYNGIVFKRRAMMPCLAAEKFLSKDVLTVPENQIIRELSYFISFYHPQPKLFIGYDRESFVGRADPGLRITFDHNVRYRSTRLSLRDGDDGETLDLHGDYLMEVKTEDALPMELVRIMSEFHLYPDSFSKYGTIYKLMNQKEARVSASPDAVCAAVREYA